jgi:pectate lyase
MDLRRDEPLVASGVSMSRQLSVVSCQFWPWIRLWALILGLSGCGNAGPGFPRANTQPAASPIVEWPKPTGEVQVDATIRVLDHFDGHGKRFYGVDDLGTSSQDENQDPMFRLSDGAVLENVIIGDPAADGVHCYGSCTLKNVWWERVGEDAATFRGQQPDDVMLVDRGGASGAKDKVFQNNGVGTMIVKNFYVENFGKLYRSCGNCSKQAQRTIVLENITAVPGRKSSCLVGINENYGDKAIFKGVSHIFVAEKPKLAICQRFLGNARGLEPSKTTSGPDNNCIYDEHSVIIE